MTEPLRGPDPNTGPPDPFVAGMPPVGWQYEALPVLRALAADEPSAQKLEVAGSARDERTLDVWSDLDVLVTATSDPQPIADRLALAVTAELGPLYASSRSVGDQEAGVRLVLADLRRIDLTVRATRATANPPALPDTGGPLARIAAEYRFDAVLAAFKTARQDLLIGAHLVLQLPRHLLVATMILRDRETGTRHHRHGSPEWNTWLERLAAVAPPDSATTITASIRHHTHVLQELLAVHAPELAADDEPLHRLLTAVDRNTRTHTAHRSDT
ncbi:hypothetical protein ACIHEI_34810 [Kitasatospora sp. NPDC051984]|uniref:hypothetical protein n=1 Tax=Kitasatospora sp. NPDC051984 TaxID=3364059 RepID=UPI0037C6A468